MFFHANENVTKVKITKQFKKNIMRKKCVSCVYKHICSGVSIV